MEWKKAEYAYYDAYYEASSRDCTFAVWRGCDGWYAGGNLIVAAMGPFQTAAQGMALCEELMEADKKAADAAESRG